MTTTIDLGERRLARQLQDALRHSDGICPYCERTWGQHEPLEIQANCVELAHQRELEAERAPSVARADKALAFKRALRSVLVATGMDDVRAELTATAQVRQLEQLGMVPL